MEPSKSLIAGAIVRLLERNLWLTASLVSEMDTSPSDGFIQEFLRLTTPTSEKKWKLEDHIRVSSTMSERDLEKRLTNLVENESHIIAMHVRSKELVKTIMRIAIQCRLTGKGYAWILTEDSVLRDQDDLKDFPLGLLGITVDYTQKHDDFVSDSVAILAEAAKHLEEEYHDEYELMVSRKGCLRGNYPGQYDEGRLFYR
jgi:hypothetical protein